MLKWWSVRGECPDNTFIKTVFSKVQEKYSGWVDTVTKDSRYKNMVEGLGLREPTIEHSFFITFLDIKTWKKNID